MKRGTKKKLVDWLIYLTTILFWSLFWLIFFFVQPTDYWRVSAFLISLYLSLFFSFYLFLKKIFFGAVGAFYITGLLLLQLIRQFHWLNVVLFTAVCLAVIYKKNS